MRKPEVDYRNFRLKNRHDPQYAHLRLLLGWAVYFAMYFLTEGLIPAENCHVSYCVLDDMIPFQEAFLIPYVLWYFLIILSLGYFLLYDVQSFRDLQTYIIVTQVIAMAVYILYPSRQELRPDAFARDNLLTRGVALIYALDTNTGVCPSLHVAIAIGIGTVWCKKNDVPKGWKLCIIASVILICLSTMFIKQHSCVDFFAAIPVCMIAYWWVYRRKKRHGEPSDSPCLLLCKSIKYKMRSGSYP